jgi:adenine-specific DNA-methyltransferase
MAQKGNDRSNAKIDDADIIRVLSTKGKVKVFTQDYKPFSAGKSEIIEHEERLFLCECVPKKYEIIQSPLNYTGGKHKLLKQILPHFPKKIDTVVDMFCGGCNVGVNVSADKVICNDNNPHLLSLYNTFSELGKEAALTMVDNIIEPYGFSRSTDKGYEFYGCESSSGLGNYNRKPFLKLREIFNAKKEEANYYIMLYVLIVFAFNNQIRFNAKNEFNLPVGKRDFNEKMKTKLCAFVDRIQSGAFTFSCQDFREVDISTLTENSLVYCDPPYLITCATYNEQGGWNEECEKALLELLDDMDSKSIKFALSNVLSSKGKTNTILLEWLNMRNYRTIHLDYSYSNSNYHTKDRTDSAKEVLIVNY